MVTHWRRILTKGTHPAHVDASMRKRVLVGTVWHRSQRAMGKWGGLGLGAYMTIGRAILDHG